MFQNISVFLYGEFTIFFLFAFPPILLAHISLREVKVCLNVSDDPFLNPRMTSCACHMRQASAGALKVSLNLDGAHTIKARDQGTNRGHNRDTSGQRGRGQRRGERQRQWEGEREREGEMERLMAGGNGRSRQSQIRP